MIGRTVQSYRVVGQLGAGGMGVVYEAEDTRLGRRVALKFLPPSMDGSSEAGARFEREARIASSLNHPNICTLHDIGTYDHDGRPQRFIVMELLEGESLRSRIQGQPLPIDLVVDVGIQIADAIDAAHAQGIVHRDIKPANIFLTKRGQAKLLDFGIAKPGGSDGDSDETRVHNDSLTVPGTAVGSINYMSPEQARGEAIDGRTDIFSLGVVLYEMATGKQAFNGQTTAVVFDAILNRDPVPARQLNPDLPDELDRIIKRSLEKDRALRFQTASDLLAELRRLRRDTDVRRVTTAASVTAAPAAPAAPTPAPRTAVVEAALPPASMPVPAAAAPKSRAMVLGVPVVLVAGVAAFWMFGGTRAPAFAERDTILIADFANSTGDAVFDDALKQAVSVQLQQTPFVTLLADQQVQRTLRLMEKSADVAVTGTVAREVCQRAGARATVEGSIAPLGSSYVIALGVHDCQTGAPIAQKQTQADSKENVLKAVGTAVTQLREGLGESLASIAKNDVPAEATTKSLEALKAYGLAQKARATKGDEASIPFFNQAVERDADFALAHAKLGVVYGNLNRAEDAKRATSRAYELRERVSEYERLYINWLYISRVAPDDAKQKEALEVLIANYPRDFSAHNNFGTYYMGKGEFAEAMTHFTLAHEIAPNEPLPSSNAAFALFNLNRFDEALAMAEKSLAVRPNPGLASTRWMQAHVRRDPRAAAFREVALKQSPPQDQIDNLEGALAFYDGRVAEYWAKQGRRRDRAVAENRAADAKNIEAETFVALALVEGERRLKDVDSVATAPELTPQNRLQAAAIHLHFGNPAPLRRELPKLEKQVPAGNQFAREFFDTARAHLLAHDGKPDDALKLLQGLVSPDPRRSNLYYAMAYIQERAGKTDEAIANYRRVVDAEFVLGLNYNVPLSRLGLVRLLKAKGDEAGAKVYADALRTQWASAPPDFMPRLELEKSFK